MSTKNRFLKKKRSGIFMPGIFSRDNKLYEVVKSDTKRQPEIRTVNLPSDDTGTSTSRNEQDIIP